MPTLYLPLGSAEAYGQMGELIVYQGVACRKYTIPKDPRSGAQLDVRHLFYDITKMVRAAADWPRANFYTAFGRYWYCGIYKRITENSRAVWNALLEDERLEGTGYEETWEESAPFKATYNDPNLVWPIVYFACWDWAEEVGVGLYGAPYWEEVESKAEMATWWAKDLVGVMMSGKFDDDHPTIGYYAYQGWEPPITDGSAYGGKFHQSLPTGWRQWVTDVYGKTIKIGYTKKSNYGVLELTVDNETPLQISQYNSTTLYQQITTHTCPHKGLHHLYASRTGSGSMTLDSIEVLNN